MYLADFMCIKHRGKSDMQGLLITFNRHITIVKENINFIIYSQKRLPTLLFCLKEVIPESKLRNILIIVCVCACGVTHVWRSEDTLCSPSTLHGLGVWNSGCQACADSTSTTWAISTAQILESETLPM